MRTLAWLLSGVLGVLSARAAVDPALYQALQWRLIGPFRGGRVLAVAGIPGDAVTSTSAPSTAGCGRPADAGRTWQPIFDAEPVGSIGALAVAPSDPAIIYVGTGEADMRSDIAHGQRHVQIRRCGQALDVHRPRRHARRSAASWSTRAIPNVVFVAALGHAYGPNAERGVFRSKDGGEHWSKVLFQNPDTGAIDLAFQPGAPDTIYAALWQTRRPPWSVYPPSNGPGSGLYVSHDGGRSPGAAISGNGFAGIARAASGSPSRRADPDRVYALVDGAREAGRPVSLR